MDTEAWRAVIHGVAKSRTRLSDWTELNWSMVLPIKTRPTFPLRESVPSRSFHKPLILLLHFWVLVLEQLVGLHRTIQLQLLQHYWLGHRLGLLWYWMVCLGNEQRSFCCFWDCLQAFHSDQCKEIEENNRMGKTRDLFKKIRDSKGNFHAKTGTIKDRNGMDLTEAKDIKKRWQEYT